MKNTSFSVQVKIPNTLLLCWAVPMFFIFWQVFMPITMIAGGGCQMACISHGLYMSWYVIGLIYMASEYFQFTFTTAWATALYGIGTALLPMSIGVIGLTFFQPVHWLVAILWMVVGFLLFSIASERFRWFTAYMWVTIGGSSLLIAGLMLMDNLRAIWA